MFDYNKQADKAIQKVTIYLGKELGLENEEDCFVTLSEPDVFNALRVAEIQNEKTGKQLTAYMDSIFDQVLVDHDFYKDGKKMETEELHRFLFRKLDTAIKVAKEYISKVFRVPQSKTAEK